MLRPQRENVNNRILSFLHREAFEWIQFDQSLIESASRRTVISINIDIINIRFREYVFFSTVIASDIFRIELGLIGGSPMAGTACRIGGDTLRAVAENASPRPRFVHTVRPRARRTAFADATRLAKVRLTRRLLMCSVRFDGGEIAIMHAVEPVEGS